MQTIPTDKEVYGILDDLDSGMSIRQITIKYGVSGPSIRNYRDGVSRRTVWNGWIKLHGGRMPGKKDMNGKAVKTTTNGLPVLDMKTQIAVYHSIRCGLDPAAAARKHSLPIFVVEAIRDCEYDVRLSHYQEWLRSDRGR